MITTTDIHGLIAFAVLNNKAGLIQAMNATGNSVASNITDDDLLAKVNAVFINQGLNALKNVLNRVPVNKSTVGDAEQLALTSKFQPPASTGKWKDWWNNAFGTIGDLLGGTSTVVGTPPVTTLSSTPAISSTIVIVIAVIGIIAIVVLTIIFRKTV